LPQPVSQGQVRVWAPGSRVSALLPVWQGRARAFPVFAGPVRSPSSRRPPRKWGEASYSMNN